MARLFKHGNEVLHLETDWRPNKWDQGKSESRVVRKVLADRYANGDVKITVLNKRQWRYSEAAVAADSWRDQRPHGDWKVQGTERHPKGFDVDGYVADVLDSADTSKWALIKKQRFVEPLPKLRR